MHGRIVQWDGVTYNSDRQYERSTTLKHMMDPQGPRAYWHAVNRESESSTSLTLGQLLHQWILEGEQPYVVVPPNKKGKPMVRNMDHAAYREFAEEHEGKAILLPSEERDLIAMRDGLYGNKEARELIEEDGLSEVTILFQDDETEIDAKARIDFLKFDGRIIDLKTTKATTPDEFRREVIRYQYEFSGALYEYARQSVPQYEGLTAPFYHVMVCNSPPYWSYVCELHRSFLRIGHARVRKAFARLKKCRDRGNTIDCYPDLLELNQMQPPEVAPEHYLARNGVQPEDFFNE